MVPEIHSDLFSSSNFIQKFGFRCKKSGYFTKSVKNITNGIFICHKQVNNDIKSNSYSLKRQKNYFCNRTTGLNDFADFEDDEREPNIPEKIEALKEEIQNIEYKAPVSPNITLEPTSKTEVRASLLVSELKDSGKDHLTSHEIIHFLKSKLPDNCKVNEKIQNIRKVKQDVLRAASKMYPNVFLSKKKNGHKEVRLILGS